MSTETDDTTTTTQDPVIEDAPTSQASSSLLQPSAAGEYILQLCKLNIPCDYGDDKFKVICKDYSKGYGTTCGFVPHWALFEAGCRMPFVNRSEADAGLKYLAGLNINRLSIGNPLFKRFVRGTTPPKGGIIYISNGPPNTEHVFIFDSVFVDATGKIWWKSWDGGQSNSKGEQCLRPKQRLLDGRTIGGRGIVGWLDPGDLTYTAPALELCDPAGDICYEPEDFIPHVNE